MNFKIEANYKKIEHRHYEKREGTLIPVGGGKDSNITLDLLNDYKKNNLCITVGKKEVSIECAKIAGYHDDKIIEVERKIDSNLLDLNNQGFLNGHTPFSTLLAFLTYFIAYITKKEYIALSNESSAEQSNVKGQNINHQYSKTFEFENDFYRYTNQYFGDEVTYFSMLRPFNELQIGMLFGELKQYHKTFRSCNIGSKSTPWKWCCNCSKCLFVFIILSPFIKRVEIIDMFGDDLFQNKELLETFVELCGFGETKPFECVGTFEEVRFAVTKTIKDFESKNEPLPYLLQYYFDHYELYDLTDDLTKKYNEKNNVPKQFETLLKNRI